MYEIITLYKDANPETDWSVLAKTYTRLGNARRKMYTLMHTGLYQAIILRDVLKQPDRMDLIRRMDVYLASNYNQQCSESIQRMIGERQV